MIVNDITGWHPTGIYPYAERTGAAINFKHQ